MRDVKTVVLRFRDLDLQGGSVDTVDRHVAIIERLGYVWWGWWKKSDERDRWMELGWLSNRLESGLLKIGLYDRETDRFFVASVSDCRYAEGQQITSPDPQATPEYYRQEDAVAWFRFIGVESTSRDQFERQFGSLPVGNLTLFAITEGASGLSSDSSDLTIGEVVLDSRVVVHLSDLHFGSDHVFPRTRAAGIAEISLEDVIVSDLATLGVERVGLLVLSGDFTTKAAPGPLFGAANDFVNNLVQRLSIDRSQVVLVPGNHDIPLHEHETEGYGHEKMVKSFMRGVLGRPVEDFMELRRYRLPGEHVIEVLTINSARLRTRELMNYGFVQWRIYDDFLCSQPSAEDVIRIAVMHHHLVPAPKEEEINPDFPGASLSVTIDAGDVIEGLQKHGFQLVLHGHQHYPAVCGVSRAVVPHNGLELEGLDTRIFCVAGGSAGAGRYSNQFPANSYSLLYFEEDCIRIRCREFTPYVAPRDRFTGTLERGR